MAERGSENPNPGAMEPRRGRRLAMACLAVAGITAMVGAAMLLDAWYRPEAPQADDVLRLAFREYVAGHFEVAKRLAEQAKPDPEHQPELYRDQHFVVGAAAMQLAFRESEPEAMRREATAAVPHLQWNARNGFPPGRTAEGQRLLGSGLLATGRFAEAVEPLRAAIAEDPTLARDLLLPLAEAKLRAPGVAASEPLRDVERWLALPAVTGAARDEGLLLKSRILAALQQWAEAEQMLQGITAPESRHAARRATAELRIAQAEAMLAPDTSPIPADALAMFDEAIAILEELDRHADAERGAEARFLAGRALRSSGRKAEALELFSSLRQGRRQAAEAVAAGLEELELLIEAGRLEETVEVARDVVREIGDPVTYDTKWFPLSVVGSRLAAVVLQLRGVGAYDESIGLAQSLAPVVGRGEALKMQAEGHRAWGESPESQFPMPAASEGASAAEQAREHLRLAGDAYAEAARLHFLEPAYLDLLWEAIDCYQAGRDHKRSLQLLDDYLRYETRTRRPRGLIAEGRGLLATGQPELAIRPLLECVEEYPRDPLRYEARLLAAISRSETGDIETARQLLEENLFDGRLAPSSPVYRDSLFILGESLYRQAHREHLRLTTPTATAGRLQPGDRASPEVAAQFASNQQRLEDAIFRLDQAVHRDRTYENALRGRRAAYLAAEAHLLAAYWPSIVAADPETLESARRLLNQERATHLSEARRRFAELRAELNSIDQRDELQSWEPAMLRKCFLSEADAMFEMGDLAEAANAYETVAQRFMNEPITLEAMLRQAQCLEQTGRGGEAQRVLQQASRVLQRIHPEEETRFAETTRYDRQQWQSLLDWLQ